VIKDGGTYLMAYTASPSYHHAGPFNELFIATSADGVTFAPYVNAAGDPIPLISYRPGYVNEVLSRAESAGNAVELGNAFGVGLGNIIKVGSTFHFYYIDSSYFDAGTLWLWAKKTSASAFSVTAPATYLTDEDGAWLTSAHYATCSPRVTYDTATGRFWLYRNPHDRMSVTWHQSVDTQGDRFYMLGSATGSITPHPTDTYNTAVGLYTDQYGTVDSTWGWYVYTGHSATWIGNASGYDSVAVTEFRLH